MKAEHDLRHGMPAEAPAAAPAATGSTAPSTAAHGTHAAGSAAENLGELALSYGRRAVETLADELEQGASTARIQAAKILLDRAQHALEEREPPAHITVRFVFPEGRTATAEGKAGA